MALHHFLCAEQVTIHLSGTISTYLFNRKEIAKHLNEKIDRKCKAPVDTNTTTAINLVFGEKRITSICADGGEDVKRIPHDLVTALEHKHTLIKVTKHPKPMRL